MREGGGNEVATTVVVATAVVVATTVVMATTIVMATTSVLAFLESLNNSHGNNHSHGNNQPVSFPRELEQPVSVTPVLTWVFWCVSPQQNDSNMPQGMASLLTAPLVADSPADNSVSC